MAAVFEIHLINRIQYTGDKYKNGLKAAHAIAEFKCKYWDIWQSFLIIPCQMMIIIENGQSYTVHFLDWLSTRVGCTDIILSQQSTINRLLPVTS